MTAVINFEKLTIETFQSVLLNHFITYNHFNLHVMNCIARKRLVLCRYLQEYSALGTAGGMYHFRDQILTGNPDLFFVMNADVCGDFPLQEMLEFHQSMDTAPHFTILATEVRYHCHCT